VLAARKKHPIFAGKLGKRVHEHGAFLTTFSIDSLFRTKPSFELIHKSDKGQNNI